MDHREVIVHLVGGGGDHTALYAGIAALGTILGVAIGAGFSYFLQRSKIGADEAQLTKRLEAEQTRLDRQLAHDRELKELEALRVVLDEAGEALAKGRVNMSRIANLWRQGLPPDDPNKVDAEAEQRSLGSLAESVGHRLMLRLPQGDLVAGHFIEAIDDLSAIARFFTKYARQTNYAEHQENLDQLASKYEESVLSFVIAAQGRYGAKVKPQGDRG
jgi:hypothetical protein